MKFWPAKACFWLKEKRLSSRNIYRWCSHVAFSPGELGSLPFSFSTIQKLWAHPWIFVFLECPIKTHSECWKSSIVSAFPITTSNLFQFLPLPFYNVQYPPGYHDLVLSLWICGVPWWMLFVGCLRCPCLLGSCWWSGSHRFGFSICSSLTWKRVAEFPNLKIVSCADECVTHKNDGKSPKLIQWCSVLWSKICSKQRCFIESVPEWMSERTCERTIESMNEWIDESKIEV